MERGGQPREDQLIRKEMLTGIEAKKDAGTTKKGKVKAVEIRVKSRNAGKVRVKPCRSEFEFEGSGLGGQQDKSPEAFHLIHVPWYWTLKICHPPLSPGLILIIWGRNLFVWVDQLRIRSGCLITCRFDAGVSAE